MSEKRRIMWDATSDHPDDDIPESGQSQEPDQEFVMPDPNFHPSMFETLAHYQTVADLMMFIVKNLVARAKVHDISKLQEPELSGFDQLTAKLKDIKYGSPEYYECLMQLEPTLEHHYKNNRHHPQFFKDGVNEMNLIDVIEMLVDWYAASQHHKDGTIMNSIDINEHRFSISPQLAAIFRNTARDFGWVKTEGK